MTKLKALNYKCLRLTTSVPQFTFKTTKDIKTLTGFFGQDRAIEAIKFGIGIKSDGYNLFAMGPLGTGKRSLIKNILKSIAGKTKPPSDWCYVHNFRVPEKPIALRLVAGDGYKFQQDMKSFVSEMGINILTILESDHYRAKLTQISKYYDRKRKSISSNNALYIDKTPKLYKLQHIKETKLQRKVVISAVKPSIKKLKRRYAKYKSVVNYLTAVYNDIVKHVADFINQDEKTNLFSFSLENPVLTKYKINLIVDNRKLKSVPIIFEESPTYSNLICRIEHDTILGGLITNFGLIKPGSLHRANGGYLIIEVRKILNNPEAWEALKSSLYARKIDIKPVEDHANYIKPISLEPMQIPLNVKVILTGDRRTYYDLCETDPDFLELFKVPVDFDEEIKRTRSNIQLYAKLIATVIKRNDLLPFNVRAVAEIIDYGSRLVEDNSKLSTRIRDIEDLILESHYWAKSMHTRLVNSAHVKLAMNKQEYRMNRSSQLYLEDIKRKFIIINTTGKAIGQVNCLSVRRVGDYAFGHPTRVTARVYQGKGKFIDIQRDIKMAGPLHSKAGMIISNFLASYFNHEQPFNLTASIAFEQIYVWTDGDSASVGELCALLSALANVPIYQNLAITGSIDQYGVVQAIGGVNEKIEGFFDVCKAKGLSGHQGVIIPAVNIKNLMLREDIVEAAKNKQFFIYPINTLEEAITHLTGIEAGKRNKKGLFPKHSLFELIEARLQKFTKTAS